ncbi:40S ribosomal protein S7 [Ceratobasidium sp. AG-Ba]|nr:40S ribosomal protein S7 [Ceratobasidium sp. AG-Ba]
MPLFIRNASPEALIPPTDRTPVPPGLSQDMIDALSRESKETGDKLYREKKYQAAHDAYKYGALTRDPNLQKLIWLNMAATNLHLKDWFAVLRDTAWVLQMDPSSVKALYRAARALIELTRFEEAVDCCLRGLKLEPHNKSLEEEYLVAFDGAAKLEIQALRISYKYHGIFITPHEMTSSPEFHVVDPAMLPCFDPPLPRDPLKATLFGSLSVIYVERCAGDVVKEFPFDEPVLPLIDALLPGSTDSQSPSAIQKKLFCIPTIRPDLLPPPKSITHPDIWDPHQEFIQSKIAVYVRTRGGNMIPISEQTTLMDVCSKAKRQGDCVQVLAGSVPIHVLRKGSKVEERFKRDDFNSISDLIDPSEYSARYGTI